MCKIAVAALSGMPERNPVTGTQHGSALTEQSASAVRRTDDGPQIIDESSLAMLRKCTVSSIRSREAVSRGWKAAGTTESAERQTNDQSPTFRVQGMRTD